MDVCNFTLVVRGEEAEAEAEAEAMVVVKAASLPVGIRDEIGAAVGLITTTGF